MSSIERQNIPDNEGPVDDVIRNYLIDITKKPLLTKDESFKLFFQLRSTNEGKRKSAFEELVIRNQLLIVSIASHFVGHGVPLSDLIQEGNFGLMRAIEKFDPNRGFQFSTYAVKWISQSLSRAIADQGRLIRWGPHNQANMSKIRRYLDKLPINDKKTIAEISKATGITPKTTAILLERNRDYHVQDTLPGKDGDVTSIFELIEDPNAESPEEKLIQQNIRDVLEEILLTDRSLDPRAKKIIEMRFGFIDGHEYTLDEIGEKFGLTRERIRQIEKEARTLLAKNKNIQELI